MASGVNIGSTTITANVNGAIGTANIDVTAATLDSITINPVDPAVAKGTSLQLTATGNFSDGTTEDLTQSVTWASSNDGTATVSNTSPTKGLATAVKVGTATISATLGTIEGSITFTVAAARLKSITIDPADASVAKGTSLQLTATGEYTDHTTEDLTGQVSWLSEDEGVAQVSNASGTKGLSTGIAAGSTTVSATFDGVEGKTTITVTPATLISITVAPANPTIAEGTNVQLTATGNFSDSSTEDLTDQASWTSSDETVAQVNNQGLVSGIAAGSALITATVESVGGSTTATVTTAALSSITLAPLNPSVAKGTTVQLTATGHFSDGSTEDLTNEVSWSSNDDTIAQVGDDSDTQGLVTGIAAGSTTIVATLGGIQGSTGITVTPAVLLRIRIQPSNPTLRVHDKLQLTAIAEFSDGTTQDVTRSTCWESSNPKVAHVISSSSHTNGRLQAIKVGRATITATFKGVEGSTLVTVTP